MDPAVLRRGPKGEIWKIEDAIHPLIKLCTQILSEDPLFFLINSYTTGLAPAVLTYMLGTELKSFHGHVDSQEIGLPGHKLRTDPSMWSFGTLGSRSLIILIHLSCLNYHSGNILKKYTIT